MTFDELSRVLDISPHFSARHHSPTGAVFFVGEREHHVAGGADVASVIEALDGQRNIEAVIEACATVPPIRVLRILASLEASRIVAERRNGPLEHAAFETALALDASEPRVELVDATAETDNGALPAMAVALAGAGFAVAGDASATDEDRSEAPRVIVATDYRAPACVDAAETARRNGQPCFLVKPSGVRPFIGPYLSGKRGEACAHCLRDALLEQRPVERLLAGANAREHALMTPVAALPGSLAAAANLAAVQLRTMLCEPDRHLRAGILWTLDFATLALEPHRLRHRPQCPGCGDPTLFARIGERPVKLRSAAIAFSEDGGFRSETPESSYARLRHLVSPVLGPVTHLHPMPGRHREAHPVYSSGYLVVPAANPADDPFDRPCAGKGTSVAQARMSALAEAVERCAGVYRGDEARLEASAEDLGDAAVHLDELQLFSDAQHDRGESAPPRLDRHTRIVWTPAWSLSRDCRRYVPLAYCYSEAPPEIGAAYCRPSSNGTAAGNCLEEAILQGLFEAIERDAIAIWWYGGIRRPALATSSRGAAFLAAQQADRRRLGWDLWALDLTHDLGVPVVAAIAVHPPSERFAVGFGCHSNPDLALRRAVSELDQVFDPEGTVA
ncbi:MAG: TOMM precursor leader peptide-binding protein, partial [Thiohalocapsa sp.]